MNESQSPIPQADAAQGLASARRRRLLKIGAGAAPATLALVGRPVHAMSYQCASVSAWGSVQVNPTASVKARMQTVLISTWSLADWCNNTSSTALKPWDALFGGTIPFAACQSTKKISDAGISAIPAGCYASDLLYTRLTTGTDFQKRMLVALLNQKIYGGKGVKDVDPALCATALDLNKLATGSYTLSTGVVWGQTQIASYLTSNNLARTT